MFFSAQSISDSGSGGSLPLDQRFPPTRGGAPLNDVSLLFMHTKFPPTSDGAPSNVVS